MGLFPDLQAVIVYRSTPSINESFVSSPCHLNIKSTFVFIQHVRQTERHNSRLNDWLYKYHWMLLDQTS